MPGMQMQPMQPMNPMQPVGQPVMPAYNPQSQPQQEMPIPPGGLIPDLNANAAPDKSVQDNVNNPFP